MYKLKWNENLGYEHQLELYLNDTWLYTLAGISKGEYQYYMIEYFVYEDIISDNLNDKRFRKLENAKQFVINHIAKINKQINLALILENAGGKKMNHAQTPIDLLKTDYQSVKEFATKIANIKEPIIELDYWHRKNYLDIEAVTRNKHVIEVIKIRLYDDGTPYVSRQTLTGLNPIKISTYFEKLIEA